MSQRPIEWLPYRILFFFPPPLPQPRLGLFPPPITETVFHHPLLKSTQRNHKYPTMPQMVPFSCQTVSTGNRSIPTCGSQVHNLLPNFLSARYPQSSPSRNAIHHPLEILQVTRSVINGGIEWEQPIVIPSRPIVLKAFAGNSSIFGAI